MTLRCHAGAIRLPGVIGGVHDRLVNLCVGGGAGAWVGGRFVRQPWWLAGGFGLLHGMGFAGALADAGLPQSNVPLALLFFNVGIELGQLAFIAVLVLLASLVGR